MDNPDIPKALLDALSNKNLFITNADDHLRDKITSSQGGPFLWDAVAKFQKDDLILVWGPQTNLTTNEKESVTNQAPAFYYILWAGKPQGIHVSSEDIPYPSIQIQASIALTNPIDEIILQDQIPGLVESTPIIRNYNMVRPNMNFGDYILNTSMVRPLWELILKQNPQVINVLLHWFFLTTHTGEDIDIEAPEMKVGVSMSAKATVITAALKKELIDFLSRKKVSLTDIQNIDNLRDLNSTKAFAWPRVIADEKMDLDILHALEDEAKGADLQGEGFHFIMKAGLTIDPNQKTNKIKLKVPITLSMFELYMPGDYSPFNTVQKIKDHFGNSTSYKFEYQMNAELFWRLILEKNPDILEPLAEMVGFELIPKPDPQPTPSKDIFTTQNLAISDRWTKFDGLGYKLYAEALTRPILDGKTKPPIAVAIQAPWGQGKTSLMRMIKEKLDKSKVHEDKSEPTATFKNIFEWMKIKAPKNMLDVKEETIPTVWFNPLYYQNSEQIWAGMAHSILKELSDRLPSTLEREKFWFYLQLKRLDKEKIRRDLHKEVLANFLPKGIAYAIAAVALIFISLISKSGSWLSDWGWTGPILSTITGKIHHSFDKSGAESWSLHDQFKEYIQEPDYEGKMGFLHFVDSDLDKAIELLLGDHPFAIFIDDLDRCSPETIKEIILAINQFLSVHNKNVFFFLGMDMAMVAEALEHSQEKMKDNTPEEKYGSGKTFGWEFMDKFIQLPFFIPKLEEKLAKNYLIGLLEKTKKSYQKIDAPEDPFKQMTRRIRATRKRETLQGLSKEIANIFEGKEKDALQKKISSQEYNFKIEEAENLEQFLDLSEESRNNFEGADLQFLEQGLSKKSGELLDDPEGKEMEKLVKIAMTELDYNPRTIKRFLNLVRLLHNILMVRGSEGDADYDRKLVVRSAHLILNWPRVVRWLQDGSSQYDITGDSINPAKILTTNSNKKFLEWKKEIEKYFDKNTMEFLSDPRFYRFLEKISQSEPHFESLINSSIFTCHANLMPEFEEEEEALPEEGEAPKNPA